MISFFKPSYSYALAFSVLAALAATPFSAHAEGDGEGANIQETTALIDAIHDSKEESAMKRGLLTTRSIDALGEMANGINKTMIDIKGAQMLKEAMPGPLEDVVMPTGTGGAEGRFVAGLVDDRINEIITDATSGRKTVENVNSDNDKSPFAAPALTADAYLWKRYKTLFCIPESASAVEECKDNSGNAGDALNKTMVSVFLSEGTWQDKIVLDSLVFARRFFGGGLDRDDYGKGLSDPINFTQTQSKLAQGNLRMAILSDLAARRAPTHPTTDSIMETMLKVLDQTGRVSSINYGEVCANDTKTAVETYACSFIGTPEASGTNNEVTAAISQSAVDRIMQFDYMLSSNLYTSIYDTTYPVAGPIERLQVFMKAQQVTQDYRNLRLLQMKVAMKAMNMLNGK